MSASIREIASSAADAAGVARSAVDLASTANRTVAKLGVSSREGFFHRLTPFLIPLA